MAKKSPARRKEAAGERAAFDDSKYEGIHTSTTFDYNELSLIRASECLAPQLENVLTIASFASLILLVLLALALGNDAWLPLIALFLVAVALLYVTRNWAKLQVRYARTTTLDPACMGGRMHVVVCEDAVHVEDETGKTGTYPLSDLRVVYENSDFILAGFTGKRYVYVPRSSLSEGRFHDLARFLTQKKGK